LLTGVGGLCMTDSAMYVSKHLAGKSKLASCARSLMNPLFQLMTKVNMS